MIALDGAWPSLSAVSGLVAGHRAPTGFERFPIPRSAGPLGPRGRDPERVALRINGNRYKAVISHQSIVSCPDRSQRDLSTVAPRAKVEGVSRADSVTFLKSNHAATRNPQ